MHPKQGDRGGLIAACQYLKGMYRKDGERVFPRTEQANGFRLKERAFRLDIRKKFFSMRVVRH